MAAEPSIARLAALVTRASPRRVLVVVRHPVTARWLASLLAQRQAVVGARILDLEGLLQSAATELAGEPLGPVATLELVRDALLADPQARFAAIADQPSYQRELLRCFVELERGLGADAMRLEQLRTGCSAESRDHAMLEVFGRFRAAIADKPWWSGRSPAMVLAGHGEVSFLRRRAAAVAIGFPERALARWELRLLDGLGIERWATSSGAAGPEQPALASRLSCAGPEAEIAAVARLLRSEPNRASAVLAPPEAIARFVTRLRHRDIPVRAWVSHRAADTATARTVRALLRILEAPEQVRRADLEQVLFGSVLRVWTERSEALGLAYPRDPTPGDLRDVWDQQRTTGFSLELLAGRLRAGSGGRIEELDQRAQRFGWAADLLERRKARIIRAHELFAGTLDKLVELAQHCVPASLRATLRTTLEDWDLLARAAVHGAEAAPLGAARVILQSLASAAPGEASTLTQLATNLDHALARASVGAWVETRSEAGGPPVWLLPHACATALSPLPERVILTGLDRHPSAPVHHGPVSERLREQLGLIADVDRFAFELRELDAITNEGASVTATWQHRDGAGNHRPPGPWIAARQDQALEQRIGVDVIALPPADSSTVVTGIRPSCALERALLDWAEQPVLRRRIVAIQSHDAATLGTHTGDLGVAVPPDRPYSASALQSFAALPYRYFVERVLGVRERERRAESASALLATEQGHVVHHALETALAARLELSEGPLELTSIAEPLLAELLDALALGYRQRAEHGRAEAIWANERDRWATELSIWWEHWRARIHDDWNPNPNRRGRPEPEVLVPAPFLLALEWSPSSGDELFELDLGLRSIPFVAAIDRIEIDPRRQRVNICDYKTGRPTWQSGIAAQLRAGIHLQLPLYARTVQQVLDHAPQRLRLPGPLEVGAMRLEYLQRPLGFAPGRPVTPQARGFAPNSPLGVDAQGQVWTIGQAAAGFTVAFVTAIEAGRFPVVARTRSHRAPGRSDRLHELARVVPSDEDRAAGLPLALEPLPDPRLAREVVQ